MALMATIVFAFNLIGTKGEQIYIHMKDLVQDTNYYLFYNNDQVSKPNMVPEPFLLL